LTIDDLVLGHARDVDTIRSAALASAMRGFERGDDALQRHRAGSSPAPRVGDRQIVDPADIVQPAMFRTDAGIVEARRDRMRLGDLAVLVLEQIGAVAVEDTGMRRRRGWRHARRSMPVARRFDAEHRDVRSSRNGWNSPIAFDPPPTGAISRSGRRPSAFRICARVFGADHRLEVADELGIGMRALRRCR
jgi:hypothetical protein